MPMDFQLDKIVDPLLKWFRENARVLPWREEPTPYRVWVSEIMLQQTRVEAVKPYFERFTGELPDVRSLAECREERLLKLWEGLGYYNRVRNMQQAAIMMMEQYDGNLPADYDKLLELKGIGNYTAGAIASIAYHIPVPAVDGNVLRVITRVTGDTSDIAKPAVRGEIERKLAEVIPLQNPGDFNQGLMELGATVCVPNGAPLCEECPWKTFCRACMEGRTGEIPVKTKQKKRKIEKKTIFVIRQENRVVLNKRPSRGLLAGMYEFPNAEGELSEQEALEWVKEQKFSPLRIQKIESSRHIFSHVEWHMTAYRIWIDELQEDQSGMLFLDVDEVKKNYPIPSAFAAYVKYFNQ